jgi:hypothetical protein
MLTTNTHSFVMKCIKNKGKLSRLMAIREWIILKVASMLKIGPAINNYFIGFDMLMYEDCS